MHGEDSKSTLDLFCEVSTCMGIVDWYYAKSLAGKTFWAFLLVASLGVTVWQTQGIITQFFNRTPYQTTISKTFVEGGIPFPNITLCNFNRAKQSLINETGINQKVLDYAFHLVPATYPYSLYLKLDNINLTEYEIEWANHFKKYNYNSAKDFYRHYGHTYDDTVNMVSSGFVPISLPYEEVWTLYGRCFKILTENMKQIAPGWNSGINMYLNPLIKEYMMDQVVNNFIQEGLLFLPDYNHQPLMPSPLLVPPGFYAGITLTATREITVVEDTPLLPPDCQSNTTFTILNETYTIQNCMYDCYLQLVFNSCACIYLASTYPGYPLCNLTTMIYCASPMALLNISLHDFTTMIYSKSSKMDNNAILVPELMTCMKRCKKPCDAFLSIDASITTTYGMSRKLRESFFAQIPVKFDEDFAENFMTVDFYFTTPEEVIIATGESVPLFTLIGNIGGQLGLWIGMSMLTLVQCAYYFVLACCKGELGCRSNKRVTTTRTIVVNSEFDK